MEKNADSNVASGSRMMSLVTALIVVAALLFLNLDGHQNHLVRRGNFFGEPPNIMWTHGWPCCIFTRDSIYPLSGVYLTDGGFYGPRGVYSRWPVDGAAVHFQGFTPLFVDLLFWILVIPGAAFAGPRVWCWLRTSRKFSLRFLLSATALVAVALAILPSKEICYTVHRAFTSSVSPSIRLRYVLDFLAIAINSVAAILTVYAILSLAMRLFWHWRSRECVTNETLVVSRAP